MRIKSSKMEVHRNILIDRTAALTTKKGRNE